jgi:hypothetical protein
MPFAWYKGTERRRIWTLLFLLSLGFSLYSIILAVITTFYIKSYCLMCILSYGINFFLLYYLWLMRKRFGCEGIIKALWQDLDFIGAKKIQVGTIFLPFFIATTLILLFFPNYWNFKPPAQSAAIPTGTTEDGHPWIGAETPELVITEYADYLCFQCKKMHYYLRELIEKNPDKIRLVHRHFPMDHEYNFIVNHPFHVGSGKMALLAVHVDVWQGMKLRMTGTPSFLIDGKVYQGRIPPDIFKKVLN